MGLLQAPAMFRYATPAYIINAADILCICKRNAKLKCSIEFTVPVLESRAPAPASEHSDEGRAAHAVLPLLKAGHALLFRASGLSR